MHPRTRTRTRTRTTLLLTILTALLACTACASNDDDGNGGKDAGPGDADAAPTVDSEPADEPFGRICELGKPCPKDPQGFPNVCIAPQGAADGKGFCTRTCNAQGGGPECYDVPNGQWSACYLKGPDTDAGPGQTYCVYLCKSPNPEGEWACPATLRCGQASDDGVALCIP